MALRFAESRGLAVPQLIAADLDGDASGTVATLETFLPGSDAPPRTATVARLREFGAAIARFHAIALEPGDDLPKDRGQLVRVSRSN